MKKSIIILSALLLVAPLSGQAEEIFMEVEEGTNLKEVLNVINEQPLPKEQVEIIEWISVPSGNDENEKEAEKTNSELKPFKPICNVFDLAKRNHGQVKRIQRESTKKIDLKAEIAAEIEAEEEAIANELKVADEKYEFIEM